MDTYLRCTRGAKRERIARRYTAPAAESAYLNRQSIVHQGMANHQNSDANLNRFGIYENFVRFGGRATAGVRPGTVSPALGPMAADVVVVGQRQRFNFYTRTPITQPRDRKVIIMASLRECKID
jgi:hypothetical protein